MIRDVRWAADESRLELKEPRTADINLRIVCR